MNTNTKKWLLVVAAAFALGGSAVPARALSIGGYGFDPDPRHISVQVPGVKIEATPLNPMNPPSIHVDGHGEIAKLLNGASNTIHDIPADIIHQVTAPVRFVASELGGALAQPLQNAGSALIADAQAAAADLIQRMQQSVTTVLIEAIMVFVTFKMLSLMLRAMFRRRHA